MTHDNVWFDIMDFENGSIGGLLVVAYMKHCKVLFEPSETWDVGCLSTTLRPSQWQDDNVTDEDIHAVRDSAQQYFDCFLDHYEMKNTGMDARSVDFA